jgi:peptidoglycan/xylan/chitin deacetylase (PgdA/CDA1 family)
MSLSVALKIDVDTYRGTKEGVPRLRDALIARRLPASFYFSLGPDHTGWALKRVFRKGFLAKVSRTSVVSHYGFPTLIYGVLWPGPHIGRGLAPILQSVAKAGHETGVHCYDHVLWQDNVMNRDEPWTRRQVQLAFDTFESILGFKAKGHCAAGWQFNEHLLALEDELQLEYASDSRGREPFLPKINGKTYQCPQLPTTLPTLDELIGVDGMTVDGAIDHLLDLTLDRTLPTLQVFTLHAELEGQQFLEPFLRLIDTWRQRGVEILTMANAAKTITKSTLPVHTMEWGVVANRSGLLAVQA